MMKTKSHPSLEGEGTNILKKKITRDLNILHET